VEKKDNDLCSYVTGWIDLKTGSQRGSIRVLKEKEKVYLVHNIYKRNN